ncbi:prostacyclin receptor [Cyprinodon tularosa]|uniref:prostacyclin receptor n=1 Tax=Cyprinodon tularosa TaxID=77115 RepID=UPI0018E25901|nr:prostacyclin receptor [Cyprinodon tularosa]
MNTSECHNTSSIVTNVDKLLTSAFMFFAGVVGNLLALFILGVHRKEHRSRSSVFCVLVTGLALTDLLGTCLLSPPVFTCYALDKSLISLGGDALCNVFGAAVIFFALAPTLILCAMALERCLAISHPYFYSVHIRRNLAKVTLFFIYIFSLAFCLLPYSGYGQFRQYCPGTWCFVKMEAGRDGLVLAFSLSYSSLMALLIFIVFVCNGSVIVSLCQMRRSHLNRRGSVVSVARKKRFNLAWFGRGEEEMDHLVLLALITVIFVVCSLPLTIAGFINAIDPFPEGDEKNLFAFRFYSLNAIMDPWVFIICRKSVFRHLCSLLSCRFGKGAMKTTTHCALSLPLDNSIARNP